MKSNSDILTTTDVARICHVSSRTATRWIDSGELKGFIVPQTRHRRVGRAELLEFIKKNKIPVSDLAHEMKKNIREDQLVKQFKIMREALRSIANTSCLECDCPLIAREVFKDLRLSLPDP